MRSSAIRSSPNSAANRFSPLRVKLTTRLPGVAIARRPFQFGEAGHERRPQRAGQMMPPLAPVEAGPAQRAARMGQRVGGDLQAYRSGSARPRRSVRCPACAAAAGAAASCCRASARRDRRPDDRSRPGRGAAPDPSARCAPACGRRARRGPRGLRARAATSGSAEAIIAVAALLFLLDQPAGLELRQMRTRGLRRDAGLVRQLARGQRAAGHQRRQHVGAGGIADQSGDHRDIGTCFHPSMLAEASGVDQGAILRPRSKHQRLAAAN